MRLKDFLEVLFAQAEGFGDTSGEAASAAVVRIRLKTMQDRFGFDAESGDRRQPVRSARQKNFFAEYEEGVGAFGVSAKFRRYPQIRKMAIFVMRIGQKLGTPNR